MYLLHFQVVQMVYVTAHVVQIMQFCRIMSPNYPDCVVTLRRIMEKSATFVDYLLKSTVA